MNLQLKSLLVLLSALEVASASQRILRNEATIVHDDEQVVDAKKHVPTATTQLDEERGLLSIESVKIDQEPCDEGLRETAGTELTLTPTTDVRRPSKCPCPTALPYVIYLLAHFLFSAIAPSVSPTLIPTDNPSERPTDFPTIGPTLNVSIR